MKNKKDIIRRASDKSGFTRTDMSVALDAFIDAISEFVIEGEDVMLFGFCKISPELMPERIVHDLNGDGTEKMVIPAHNVPRVKFSDTFKEQVKFGKK